MKNQINLQINGKPHTVTNSDALLPLADYLRYKQGLMGTKVVCAEGDCGACTLLVADAGSDEFKSINSCIGFVYQYDGKNIITVEGLKNQDKEHNKDTLHPVQDAMAQHHGAQCGYCTPGIVCSLAELCDKTLRNEDKQLQNKQLTEKTIKNALTGNLCRCTGYEPIIKAGQNIDISNAEPLASRYPLEKVDSFAESIAIEATLKQTINSNNTTETNPTEENTVKLFIPTSMAELLALKDEHPNAKLISGGTDLGVLSNKFKWQMQTVISLVKMNLNSIDISEDSISIGAGSTLHEVEKALENDFPEFSRLLHVFASPQIKNSATLVGNLANGSPIGDSIPFLKVVHATLELASVNGTRLLDLNDFYLDYKKMDIKDNEVITKVILPKSAINKDKKQNEFLKLYKVSARRDLDISAVTFAGKMVLDTDNQHITDIAIAFGGVGSIVLRMTELENDLTGKPFSKEHFKAVANKVMTLVSPFADVRGSDIFRKQLCHNLIMKFYDEVTTMIANGSQQLQEQSQTEEKAQ